MTRLKMKKVELLSYRSDPALQSMLESGYHCCILNPFCTNVHTHDFYEITYCISGQAVHCVNHQEVIITSGTLLIMRPDEMHCFKNYANANALTVCITPEEFHSFLEVYNLKDCKYFSSVPERTPLPPHIKTYSTDSFYLQNLCENITTSADPHSSPYLKVFLGHALGIMIQQELTTEHNMPKHFRYALTKMNQLENVKGGVKTFLSLANLSHAQLCRLTKKHLDMTPHDYVNSIRMKWAYSLLLNTDMDVEMLAESIGFSSYSHFHKLFKETYHITPGKLREKNTETFLLQ